jgi:serine protease
MIAAAQAEGPPQRVIVKYRTTLASAQAASDAAQAVAEIGSRFGVALKTVRRTASGADVLAIDSRLSTADLQQLIATLASTPGVEYAEEDQLLRAVLTPNDTRYNEQWHYFESSGGLNLPTAWDSSSGTGVTVAVIDTGYRPHADLAANLVGGYDFISDTFVSRDGNGRDSDAQDPGDWTLANDCAPGWLPTNSSWHGTHVSGTVAARTNNATGVAGVAFNARVLPVRVLGRCGGFTSDIADAVIWASGGSVSGIPTNANPARVISLSLGGSGACGTTMQNAINSARSRNTALVIAAGNSNANASNATPANCAGVIAVAAVNRSGGRAFYSNFGAVVDVAAPGGDTRVSATNGVLSTLNSGTTTPGSDSYAFYQGTSMATPHVAGVVALVLSVNGALTPDQVETTLRNTTRPFPATCSQCGTGIVNATAAVAAAGGGPPPSSCPAGYTEHNGTLSGTGASAYLPSTAGYVTTVTGLHSGRLTGPSSADFDLYLYRRSAGIWRIVARSEGTTSTENIDFNSSSGTYRWRVYSFSGSGQFKLCQRHP